MGKPRGVKLSKRKSPSGKIGFCFLDPPYVTCVIIESDRPHGEDYRSTIMRGTIALRSGSYAARGGPTIFSVAMRARSSLGTPDVALVFFDERADIVRETLRLIFRGQEFQGKIIFFWFEKLAEHFLFFAPSMAKGPISLVTVVLGSFSLSMFVVL